MADKMSALPCASALRSSNLLSVVDQLDRHPCSGQFSGMVNLSRMRMWWIAVASLWLSAALSYADGKMYVAEKIPTRIPYQRALILHDEGVQTMVLQSQYQIPGGSKARSLGWVVPMPAPPEVASVAADDVEQLFRMIDWKSAAKVTRISNTVYITLFLICLAGAPVSLIWSFLPRASEFKERLRLISFYCLSGVVFLFFMLCLTARAWKGADGVEIIRTERCGIHDVQVVRARDAGELVAWLNANSFHYGEADKAAIASYIGRGWCFVVSKVDPRAEASDSAVVTKGLLAPLILRFASPNPVYPVALTATGGHPTDILIYLASKVPMRTDSPLTLRYSGSSQVAGRELAKLYEVDPPEFFQPLDKLLEFTHLTKFKATLSPAQMAKDIEFHPVPGAPDYRERIYRW